MARDFQLCLAFLTLGSLALAESPPTAGDWPQWRGPNRDGISLDRGLLKEWPKDGLPVAWQLSTVGVGYSSIAVKDGNIYTQGDVDGVESVICLNAADGSTRWIAQPDPVAKQLATRVVEEFKKIDTDQSGTIDELEALKRFGWDWNKFNKAMDGNATERPAALFRSLDKNQNGSLEYAEAGELLRDAFQKADSEDKSADAAKLAANRAAELMKADSDGDQKVSKEEAKGLLLERLFGDIDVRDPATEKGDELLTNDEIEQYLKRLQPGRDGVLTREELAEYYKQSGASGDAMLDEGELRSAIGGYRSGMGDGPRGTPCVDGDLVYALGALGDLACLSVEDGKTIWHVNLVKDFEGNMPGAGYCESPLVAGNLLIVTPGGEKGTMLALDKLTGKQVWRCTEAKETTDYASAITANIGGTEQVVQFGRESVFGVSLADGRLLWRYTAPASPNANCCTPIIDGDHVFAATSYGVGGGLAKIVTSGQQQKAEEVYFEKRMGCHHGGMVKIGDHVFTNADGPLVCMEFKTGKIEWKNRSIGKGALCAADGMLYLVSEGGEVALVEASPEAYHEHGRFKADLKKSILSHPAVAGGRLYIRAQDTLVAYDLRDQGVRLASPANDPARAKR